MGSRSRAKRMPLRDDAERSGAGRHSGTITLRDLAESMASDLAKKARDKRGLTDVKPGTTLASVAALFVYEGRRRSVHLPPDLFDASRDLQVGCVYGALVRVVRPTISVCLDCGKLRQDLFRFDGKELVKAPSTRGGHVR